MSERDARGIFDGEWPRGRRTHAAHRERSFPALTAELDEQAGRDVVGFVPVLERVGEHAHLMSRNMFSPTPMSTSRPKRSGETDATRIRSCAPSEKPIASTGSSGRSLLRAGICTRGQPMRRLPGWTIPRPEALIPYPRARNNEPLVAAGALPRMGIGKPMGSSRGRFSRWKIGVVANLILLAGYRQTRQIAAH